MEDDKKLPPMPDVSAVLLDENLAADERAKMKVAAADVLQKVVQEELETIQKTIAAIQEKTGGRLGTFFLANFDGPFIIMGNECKMCVAEMLMTVLMQTGQGHDGGHAENNVVAVAIPKDQFQQIRETVTGEPVDGETPKNKIN